MTNNNGPSTEPCGIPDVTLCHADLSAFTPTCCTLLDRKLSIREHIIELMKRNNFFTKKQYGFISGRSTALQLLEVLDKWTDALDLGYSIDCVYMDYQNTFDTVPHKRLHNKLTS
jgi:hypothetical protein